MEIQEKYKNLGDYGCYFFDLLKHFGKLDKAIDYYDKYTSKGWMGYDCFIQRPLDLVKDLSGYNKWNVEKTTSFKKGDIVIAYYFNKNTGLHHFVLFDNDNKLVWDSLGESNTVRNGVIESYRVFTRY